MSRNKLLDTLDFITLRRSIRKYSNKKVSAGLVNKILEAGMSAPSAENQQTWQFIVINKKSTLKKIARINTPYPAFAKEASVGILVCGNPDRSDGRGFWVQDCAAASQNILLAANSLGLGSVWIGIYPKDDYVQKFNEKFNLPDNIYPVSFIPIGFPAEEKPPSARYDKNKIHHEKWS